MNDAVVVTGEISPASLLQERERRSMCVERRYLRGLRRLDQDEEEEIKASRRSPALVGSFGFLVEQLG